LSMARIAFFGTPELAATCFEAVLASRHDVVVAVCQPDKPQGRGHKLAPPPVQALAQARDVRVLQPTTWKAGTEDGDAAFAAFTALQVDLAVVAAYGRILPKRLLAAATKGFVNVHASLLPRWRGAAPIQRAIEAGDDETGVCLMDMIYELDAGDVFARRAIPIAADDDGDTLAKKFAQAGAHLLREHLDELVAGSLPRAPQPNDGVTYAKMLTKEEGRVVFARPTRHVVDHARAMHPWPGAYTTLGGETLKLFAPLAVSPPRADCAPGTVLAAKDTLVVATADGAVSFSEVQAPNKRRMLVSELVRGRPIEIGALLGT
jgi:methionyl-tRNA formyltransferase